MSGESGISVPAFVFSEGLHKSLPVFTRMRKSDIQRKKVNDFLFVGTLREYFTLSLLLTHASLFISALIHAGCRQGHVA